MARRSGTVAAVYHMEPGTRERGWQDGRKRSPPVSARRTVHISGVQVMMSVPKECWGKARRDSDTVAEQREGASRCCLPVAVRLSKLCWHSSEADEGNGESGREDRRPVASVRVSAGWLRALLSARESGQACKCLLQFHLEYPPRRPCQPNFPSIDSAQQSVPDGQYCM